MKVAEYEPVEIDVQKLYRRGLTRMSTDMHASSLPRQSSTFSRTSSAFGPDQCPTFRRRSSRGGIDCSDGRSAPGVEFRRCCASGIRSIAKRFVIEAARLLALERGEQNERR